MSELGASVRPNWVRDRLRRGEPTLGCFVGLGSPAVAELLATAGLDWLIVETEHNALDSAEVEHMLRAIDAAGMDTVPLVRLPSADPVYIQKALDIGARGIVVPMVRSADEARAIVAATRYPPAGRRSFGPLRSSRYTFASEDYFRTANHNVLVVLVLETKEAIDDLEEICAVDGIDALYLGFADLSLNLGLTPFDLPHPDVDAVVKRVIEVGARTGVAVGNGATNANDLADLAKAGYTFIGFGPDYYLLSDAARAGRAALDTRG